MFGALTCDMQVSDPANGETKEVKGACSELCAAQTMPSCPFPPNPGQSRKPRGAVLSKREARAAALPAQACPR